MQVLASGGLTTVGDQVYLGEAGTLIIPLGEGADRGGVLEESAQPDLASPWGRPAWRARRGNRSALAELISSSRRLLSASSLSSPWRSRAATYSAKTGISLLAQMQLAMRQTCSSATTTGPRYLRLPAQRR